MEIREKSKPKKYKRLEDEKTSVFFENIKKRRTELGLKQADLAERMGIKQSQISSLENGTFVETPERIELIAKALETTPDYLFGFKEEP